MAGFKGTYLLVDRKSGKSIGITPRGTEKNLQTSSAKADKLRAQASGIIGASKLPTVEICEIAVQA